MRKIAIAGVIAALMCLPERLFAQVPQCPLVVERVGEYGLSAQITVRNQATYPVRHLVFHVTFNDGLRQYHEKTYHADVLVQPRSSMVFTTPPITDAVVVWSTLAASVGCRAVQD